MLIRFLGLIVLLVLINCTDHQCKIKKNIEVSHLELGISLIQEDTLIISIDSTTSNVASLYQIYKTNDDAYFSIYNSNSHTIQLYNLVNGINNININLAKQGPNGLPDLLGFYIHNLDSIFIFPMAGNVISLINRFGEIQHNYDLSDPLTIEESVYELDFNIANKIYYNPSMKDLSFGVTPYVSRKSKSYYEKPFLICYNIANEQITKVYGEYPANYQCNKIHYLHEEAGRMFTDKFEVHHFSGSHELLLYDKKTKYYLKTIFAKSQFLDEEIESLLEFGDTEPGLQEQHNFLVENGAYTNMFYDDLNKISYRIVRHNQELYGNTDLLNSVTNRKKTVMIFDENFSFIGESIIPAASIDPISFSNDGYLYISINHPENEATIENEFHFIKYKPIIK